MGIVREAMVQAILNLWNEAPDEHDLDPRIQAVYRRTAHQTADELTGAIEKALIELAGGPEECDCNEGYGYAQNCGACHGSGVVGHPPKYLVLRIRDGELEEVDCPYFVLLAKDTHAVYSVGGYYAGLVACGKHSREALDAVREHFDEFTAYRPTKEPD